MENGRRRVFPTFAGSCPGTTGDPEMTRHSAWGLTWLLGLCLSRLSFSLISVSYAAVLPIVREAWGISATEAGLIQSSWLLGYLASLILVGIGIDRFGAKRVFITSSYLACISATLFACLASGFWSALLLL